MASILTKNECEFISQAQLLKTSLLEVIDANTKMLSMTLDDVTKRAFFNQGYMFKYDEYLYNCFCFQVRHEVLISPSWNFHEIHLYEGTKELLNIRKGTVILKIDKANSFTREELYKDKNIIQLNYGNIIPKLIVYLVYLNDGQFTSVLINDKKTNIPDSFTKMKDKIKLIDHHVLVIFYKLMSIYFTENNLIKIIADYFV